MKKTLTIAGFLLLASGTAAFAASPDMVISAVASCCNALAVCCGAGMPCCP